MDFELNTSLSFHWGIKLIATQNKALACHLEVEKGSATFQLPPLDSLLGSEASK